MLWAAPGGARGGRPKGGGRRASRRRDCELPPSFPTVSAARAHGVGWVAARCLSAPARSAHDNGHCVVLQLAIAPSSTAAHCRACRDS